MEKISFKLNAVARISLGLMGLIMTLLFIADILFEIFPKPDATIYKIRSNVANSLAIQMINLIEADQTELLDGVIQDIKQVQPEIASIGIRSVDGVLNYATADHLSNWTLTPDQPSTINNLRVPVYSHHQLWGNVEISYTPDTYNDLFDQLTNNHIVLFSGLAFFTTLLIYLYLSRALHYLNPSKAVPTRIHNAFDIIADGILVIDHDGKILLANQAFLALDDNNDHDVYGKTASDLNITNDLIKQIDQGRTPWENSFIDITFTTIGQDNQTLTLLASSTPITDDNSTARGYLLTFKNITELHETNLKLSEALQELKLSRSKLEINNQRLQEMAYRDPLTGCLNRRAFFEKAEDQFTLASQGNRELYCIMADIDFFKSFNDIYGHYIGDQVIQIVAKIFSNSLRPTDLICRYGGEEFCILLTDISMDDAMSIAERMRKTVEETANQSLRNDKVKTITSSFGIASIDSGANSLENLIDYADNALYMSKETGRNKVTQWMSSLVN